MQITNLYLGRFSNLQADTFGHKHPSQAAGWQQTTNQLKRTKSAETVHPDCKS